MKWLIMWCMRLFLLLWLLSVLIVGAWFLQENTQVIKVTLLGFSFAPASVGLVVALALLCGLLLGFLVILFTVQPRLMLCKRELSKVKKEIATLRSDTSLES